MEDKAKKVGISNLVLCDVKGCGTAAVAVFEDYSKCSKHDREEYLKDLIKELDKNT